MRRPPAVRDLRAAWWANRVLRKVRRELAAGRTSAFSLPSPPPLPATARRGVEALLRRRRHSCLEGALVRQRWLAAHAIHRDVVIGVASPAEEFVAHAWLDGDHASAAAGYIELTRLPA